MKSDEDRDQKLLQTTALEEAFPPPTEEDWKKAAEALLKGASFDKTLKTQTAEGITLSPIYTRRVHQELELDSHAAGTNTRRRAGSADGYLAGGWLISQELPYGSPEEFNRAALLDLSRGQTELNIPLDLATRSGHDPDQASPGRVGACGLSLSNLNDLDRALRDVVIDAVSLYFRCGSSGLPIAALLVALAEKRGVNPAKLKGCIEIDPLASLARLGRISVSLERAFDEMAITTRYMAEKAPGVQTIGVSGDPYHDGGGSAVDELGFVISTGVEYLREMARRGVSPEIAAPRMRFAFSVGSNFFMEIAKLRAARVLWARVLESWGLEESEWSMHIHTRSSIWNKSRLDPHTNMLRTTTEAFSAVLGGTNSMHVSPFDEVFRVPDDFSRRIARNQQLVLQEECELTRTIDPAGGSYYVEWLTDQLAEKAWSLFQEVERDGGMTRALHNGMPQERVARTRDERFKRIQQRRDSLVGVNMYPNAAEQALEPNTPDYEAIYRERAREVQAYRTSADADRDTKIMSELDGLMCASGQEVMDRAVEAVRTGATLGEISRAIRRGMGGVTSLERHIPLARAAQQYEELRNAARAYAEGSGEAPRILQANIGPSRGYRVRADWTTAFFQAGGFTVLADEDYDDVEAAVRAAELKGAPIVVITSADDKYPEVVAPLAKALKALQYPPYVLLAGAPGDKEQEYRDAGVDDFVNVRVNNYEMNRKLLETIGVLEK